ncbi:uncharacterized protein CcaverHIS019_0408850 [Cutaneotrichosporon cavernicola]|uniref:Major facilitator superfamily MFS-1 n=1 Tax=Cutaneotrichosporon cavernicola TaxID=279322 RepID=A0AA48L518_9TREE|nr:uncharacterized protein CcaverHIS019_0408850 [Cutaneotrichosporon cavernicola]BEI92065.1 hypothetical protein CcaverHIS019_0408850 [Cutaneotrichosporon cavernicola]BEI99835.1 hypothetical protein CcaverHIS631_0408780 [Cutaneotrichosporon cavernicola]BEJ07611.1 hypothetical protein CcaverHIS641_0408800 [Cutaneotrichosporon cavernicola]
MTSTSASGAGASAAADALATPVHNPRRVSSVRPSFSTFHEPHRRSRAASRSSHHHFDDADFKLPSLVPGIRPAYSTPLPVLPMIVLCIAMLSELLSANLSQPFMLNMVEKFFLAKGHTPEDDLDATVGLWTGNLVSVFYITQFLTSLLWSSIADRHGRRAVLVASMLGNGVALLMFGTSQSLPEAICVRLIQGIFGGAIGVFRGSVRDLTDDTNATRAYAMLGFSWGLGGVVGPVIGGVFESPSVNWPGTFLGRIPMFERLPYFLPTLLGGSIMFIGAVLACFLSWDGGVRGGQRIQLEVEKDEPLAAARGETPAPSRRPTLSQAMRISNTGDLLSPAAHEGTPLGGSMYGQTPGYSSSQAPQYGQSAPRPMPRHESMASIGTAYGYGGIRSKHPTLAARRAIEAARRRSAAQGGRGSVGEEDADRNISFATKLLLANEENTFNINDLWLSAAVAQDTAVFDDDDEYDEDLADDDDEIREGNLVDLDDASSSVVDTEDNSGTPLDSSFSSPVTQLGSPSRTNFHRTRTASLRYGRPRVFSTASTTAGFRRPSGVSSRRHSGSSNVIPAIFSNTGLASTPGIAAFEEPADDGNDLFSPTGTVRRMGVPALTAINEQQQSSPTASSSSSTHVAEKPTSRWKLLPLLVISQYGLLACHDSAHAQIFLSFIITPYKSGGVGVTPANYSVFVAIMCVGQLVYQFYLFPRLGPPLGRFSMLQMFRLGCWLYVPGYILVPLLHPIASPTSPGNFITMTSMSLISALRYCGGTFAYTAIMILINVMSPPHLIGLSNGLAQSTVSMARFFGPAIGGAIWSSAIGGNPSGYPNAFYIVTIIATIQCLGTYLIH